MQKGRTCPQGLSHTPLGAQEKEVGKRRRPSVAAPPAEGPPKKSRLCRRGKSTPEKLDPDGWQSPKKTVQARTTPSSQPVESHNYYETLSESSIDSEHSPPEKEEALGASTSTNTRASERPKRTKPKRQEVEPDRAEARVEPNGEGEKEEVALEAQQIYDRPHQASYFIPGRIEGRPSSFY